MTSPPTDDAARDDPAREDATHDDRTRDDPTPVRDDSHGDHGHDGDHDGDGDDGAGWTRTRLAVIAALAVVAVLTIWVAGRQTSPPSPPLETQRLGPEPGESVAAYLARAAASVDAVAGSAEPVWALVQLAESVPTADAAALVTAVGGPRAAGTPTGPAGTGGETETGGEAGTGGDASGGVRVSRVVFRVPLRRVQTALETRDVPGQQLAAEFDGERLAAATERTAAAERRRADGLARPAAVAAAEAAALRDPACPCVLALLVRARPVVLARLAGDPAVRAVHAATPEATLPAIALSPLLPEQVDLAGPVPDDGPVPGDGPVPDDGPVPGDGPTAADPAAGVSTTSAPGATPSPAPPTPARPPTPTPTR